MQRTKTILTLTLEEELERGLMSMADCVHFPKYPPPSAKCVIVGHLLYAFSTFPQAEPFLAALLAVVLGLALVSAMD